MDRFRQLLVELRGGRSYREAEKLTGVSHGYIERLEKGISTNKRKASFPSAEYIRKLAIGYKYPYTSLMKAAGYIDDEVRARIKQIRESLGLSRAEFGEKIGVSEESMIVIEEGDEPLESSYVEKIADVAGVSVDDLLGIEPPLPLFVRVIHEKYTKSDKDQQIRLENILTSVVNNFK